MDTIATRRRDCQYMGADILPENPMAGDIILQAIAEAVLNAPLRAKSLRRLRWAVLLVLLGMVVALTALK